MTAPLYLDNLATTQLDPAAVEAMLPWLREHFGNASSSTHEFGWRAADAVGVAREEIAALIGAKAAEIVFTSGATESNNTVIKGLCASWETPSHVVTSAIEHPSVLEPLRAMTDNGHQVTLVQPDSDGLIDPDAIKDALRPHTRLISVMAANNEVASVQPIAEIAALARERGLSMHVDAAQLAGKLALDVAVLDLDFVSVSAHKFHGPQGLGVLCVRRRAGAPRLAPLLHGGMQENGSRSGTLPVALTVGAGAAARIARERWREYADHGRGLSDRLWRRLREVEGLVRNGPSDPERVLPGCLAFSVEGVTADALIASCPTLAFSAASACSSHHGADSHVLRALGYSERRRQSSVRLSAGRFTTVAEIDAAGEAVVEAIARLRRGQLHSRISSTDSMMKSSASSSIPVEHGSETPVSLSSSATGHSAA